MEQLAELGRRHFREMPDILRPAARHRVGLAVGGRYHQQAVRPQYARRFRNQRPWVAQVLNRLKLVTRSKLASGKGSCVASPS